MQPDPTWFAVAQTLVIGALMVLAGRSVRRVLCSMKDKSAVPASSPSPVANLVLPPHVDLVLPPLTAAEMDQVCRGKLVFRPYRNDSGINRGVAVQIVHATEHEVWRAILDFENYPRMVPDVCRSDVYDRSGGDIKVAVTVGYGVVGLTTSLHHKHDQAKGQLTWTLDAGMAHSSSFKTNEGFWVVRPNSSASCIVYYSIAVELKGWVPSWVNSFVASQGLPRAVAWLKTEAERRHEETAVSNAQATIPSAEASIYRRASSKAAVGPDDPVATFVKHVSQSLVRCLGVKQQMEGHAHGS